MRLLCIISSILVSTWCICVYAVCVLLVCRQFAHSSCKSCHKQQTFPTPSLFSSSGQPTFIGQMWAFSTKYCESASAAVKQITTSSTLIGRCGCPVGNIGRLHMETISINFIGYIIKHVTFPKCFLTTNNFVIGLCIWQEFVGKHGGQFWFGKHVCVCLSYFCICWRTFASVLLVCKHLVLWVFSCRSVKAACWT